MAPFGVIFLEGDVAEALSQTGKKNRRFLEKTAAFTTIAGAVVAVAVYFFEFRSGMEKVDSLYKLVVNPASPARGLASQVGSLTDPDTGVPHIRTVTDGNRDDILAIRHSLDQYLPRIAKEEFDKKIAEYEARITALESENARLNSEQKELSAQLAAYREQTTGIHTDLVAFRATVEERLKADDVAREALLKILLPIVARAGEQPRPPI
ncbi:hypothetical protein NJB93_19345 [Brucella intermedia]|uniref:hypothetical protein n=1 Tax=Brucella intermedia TaxID=94625 RepID=UPI00209AFDC6|nr:hypothetical protein [Brucella intermedia]MCO7728739.1 hypothetical protein [Brucella intermedia]